MKASAALRVTCADKRIRERLASVLAPDNEGLPKGLKISVAESGRGITFSIDSDSVSTSLSTALAFLRDIALFEEISLLSRRTDGRPKGVKST
ncbi:MAG: hypothetical protein JRN21_07175 [Nitrososphaerota archaeon]|nr:hypothetical protein [Nitrososphaerota archaeon]